MRAVQDLGLPGSPLMVHASLRSFGNVEGGAETVVDTLLDEGCTVAVPTFSDYFEIAPPEHLRPKQNGWDYSRDYGVPATTEQIYSPDSRIINANMGAVPTAINERQDRCRGHHPINSFAAVGPLAAELIRCQSPEDVYAPIRALAAADGYVVLMGVGLDRMTALHLAENLAGRTLFYRWAVGSDGEAILARIGSCSNGFPRLDEALAPIESRLTVGKSLWRVFPLGRAVEVAASAIRDDPDITHCSRPDCLLCHDAIAGGPLPI